MEICHYHVVARSLACRIWAARVVWRGFAKIAGFAQAAVNFVRADVVKQKILITIFHYQRKNSEKKLQPEEIADAQWFDPENCPASPKPGSIAYRLIHKLY